MSSGDTMIIASRPNTLPLRDCIRSSQSSTERRSERGSTLTPEPANLLRVAGENDHRRLRRGVTLQPGMSGVPETEAV